jgi:multiple antibiotic resistance protein
MVATLLAVLKIVPTIFIALFPVINPIGTALILSGMAKDVPPDEWKAISLKIAIYTFLVLTSFFLFGFLVLKLFGITIQVVQVSGGLVLACMGWQMLMSSDESKKTGPDDDDHHASKSAEDKIFYPFTFPLTVGPGGLAIVLTFGAHLGHATVYSMSGHIAGIIGISAICLVVYFCYANLKYIDKKFSPAAAMAVSKMVAFFVICIGVEIFWSGLKALMG